MEKTIDPECGFDPTFAARTQNEIFKNFLRRPCRYCHNFFRVSKTWVERNKPKPKTSFKMNWCQTCLAMFSRVGMRPFESDKNSEAFKQQRKLSQKVRGLMLPRKLVRTYLDLPEDEHERIVALVLAKSRGLE